MGSFTTFDNCMCFTAKLLIETVFSDVDNANAYYIVAHKEMIRERKRMNQRSELASKSKDRKERISKLANLRSSNTVDTIQSTEPKSSVEDRHKRVMEKLNTARPKSNSKFNVFKLNKK